MTDAADRRAEAEVADRERVNMYGERDEWATNGVPNPGTDRAREQGCKCPVLDNWRGNPALAEAMGGFWVNEDCPVHALGGDA